MASLLNYTLAPNGQTLYGVNDLFIGPKTHGSAYYFIRSGESTETQAVIGVAERKGVLIV